MSSKRRVRYKACSRKVRYGDQASAIAASIAYRKKFGGNVRTYKCAWCKGFRFGHFNPTKFI